MGTGAALGYFSTVLGLIWAVVAILYGGQWALATYSKVLRCLPCTYGMVVSGGVPIHGWVDPKQTKPTKQAAAAWAHLPRHGVRHAARHALAPALAQLLLQREMAAKPTTTKHRNARTPKHTKRDPKSEKCNRSFARACVCHPTKQMHRIIL